MAVYYKFKSAKDYDLIPMDGPFISVGTLKEKIFESKHLGRGTDFDLVVTNAQTNEEYLDEASLIPKSTAVLIRRVPGRPRMPIVTEQEPKVEPKVEDIPQEKSGFAGADSSAFKYTEDTEWDEFGNDLYAIPEVAPVQSSLPPPEAPPASKADEDCKIKALIDTPALDWQRQGNDGFGLGRGFGRGMGGRMGGRGFGMERKNPPQGYVCHRCKVPGHFIQHCPTNGDPNYDIKRVKPPTGIPKSMLMATPDGSYALPSGAVAVLKPNEAAFEREIEGLPSTRPVGDLPRELHCPLCNDVMKDAVLTSKCCFKSFCDKCIRDYIISKSKCVCGATSILADDLLPNKTLRDTINRILESGNSSADNAGSTFHVQDMESARCPQPKFPSPTQSAASKEEPRLPPSTEPVTIQTIKPNAVEEKPVPAPVQPSAVEKPRTSKVVDASEATHESISVKEPAASQGSAPLMEEEVQQKLAPGDAAKKKKKKKVRMPPQDMWKASQDLGPENFMMPMPPAAYNPYMMGGGMQPPGMDPYMNPYGGPPMPFMGYGLGPMDMPPFGGMMPPDPFAPQGFMNNMMPMMPPQRDLADLGMGMGMGMGMNHGPPAMSREEFEARKAEMRRRREMERRAAESHREFQREREFGREVSSSGANDGGPSMKSRNIPPSGDSHHRHRPERPSPDRPAARELDGPPPQLPPQRSSKRKSDHSDHGSSRDKDKDKDRDHDHYHHHEHRDRERDYDHHSDRERERGGDRDHHHHHHRSSKRSSESSTKTATAAVDSAAAAAAAAAAERKRKASVFSRISFPEGEAASKKRKGSSSSSAAATEAAAASAAGGGGKSSASANGYYDRKSSTSVGGGGGRKSSSAAVADYESSDDDERHFKRKPSRYEPSPPPAQEWDEDVKHSSRSSRDRKHR